MTDSTTRLITIEVLYCIRLNFWEKGVMNLGNQV